MIPVALSLFALVASSEGTETPVAAMPSVDDGRPTLCCKIDPYKPGSRLGARLTSLGGVPTVDCVFTFRGSAYCPAGTRSLAPSDGPDVNPPDIDETSGGAL
jgi:hypothetical protein